MSSEPRGVTSTRQSPNGGPRKVAADRPPSRARPVADLRVGAADDAFEREAERVADRAMAGGAPLGGLLRRDGAAGPRSAPPVVHEVLRSPGRPLEPATRAQLEPRLGHGLGGVRIHDDARAAASAAAVDAEAYTVGADIAFAAGRYVPHDPRGARLLAHELAHVAQHAAGARQPVLRRVPAQYADLFDYDEIADEIHTAMKELGTDEQAIYHPLERLQRDPNAIARVQAAYRTRHGVALVADLNADLSGSELDYALRLLNLGGAVATTAIGALPATATDHDAAAQRIHQAVELLVTDEEAVYAVLMAYGRSSGRVAQLRARYQALFGEDLRDVLVDAFFGDELDHVLYLMGESTLEQAELSPAAADRLFRVMADLTFTDSTGAQSPVPYHYPVDGCYTRAQLMAQVMTRAGISSERVFATSTVAGRPLTVASPYSADQPGSSPAVTRWFYHVAPLVQVRTAAGVVPNVIDPSTQPGPVTIDAWLATMGVTAPTFGVMTHAQLLAHLAAPSFGPRYRGFPAGEQLAWTTSRNVVFETSPPEADSARAEAAVATRTAETTGFAAMAAVHEIAAAVRQELARPGCTAADVVAAIRRGPPTMRVWLWLVFPTLRGELATRFPADRAAIDAAPGP